MNFWQFMWNPKEKWDRRVKMLFYLGWVVAIANWLPIKTGSAHDKSLETMLLTIASSLLCLPLIIYGIIQIFKLQREIRQLNREINAILDEIIKTVKEVQADLDAQTKERLENDNLVRLLKTKSGPREHDPKW